MRVRSGRKVLTRAERVLAALTAAAVPAARGQLPTIDLPHYGLAQRAFYDAVIAKGYTEATRASWPSDGVLVDAGRVLHREGTHTGVYMLDDGSIVLLDLCDGWCNVHVAAPDRAALARHVTAFQTAYPPLYLNRDDEGGPVVPITFWMMGRFGPERRLRRVEAANWGDVDRNYSGDVRAEVARLVSPAFTPGAEGQLLLWYGPPGTGKTWAIRALASAWAPWAEFHYITDPDAFFVQDASYMVDVLLHESYEVIDEPTGDLVTQAGNEKWRILILEDTGELLAADAKAKSGQGLSRLLNVVDGMIGQGLRILVLVTTNDEIEALHPAVSRPGRCACSLIFGPLSAEEATEWSGRPVDQPMTLAELYAAREDAGDAFAEGDAFLDDLVAALAEPVTDAPSAAFENVVTLDPLTQAALDAARQPLPDLPAEAAPLEELARNIELGIAPLDPALQFALQAVAESHQTSVMAIVDLLAAGRTPPTPAGTDPGLLTALEVLREFARRPEAMPAPAPDIHVHVPEQPVHVQVEGARVEPHLHLAPQEPPVVNIGETRIHVEAPEPTPVHVDVHVPETPPAPAPVVNVHTAAAPPAPDRRVRVIEDMETGAREFVVENVPPDATE